MSLWAGVSGPAQMKQLSIGGVTSSSILLNSNVLQNGIWDIFRNYFSTKECLWWNINANNQLRIMKKPWLDPDKLLKARFLKNNRFFDNHLAVPELEQVFSWFPTGVEFQHFSTCYYTPLQTLVKKLFGNDLVGRYSYVSLTIKQVLCDGL